VASSFDANATVIFSSNEMHAEIIKFAFTIPAAARACFPPCSHSFASYSTKGVTSGFPVCSVLTFADSQLTDASVIQVSHLRHCDFK
jgi:hypothetical protein